MMLEISVKTYMTKATVNEYLKPLLMKLDIDKGCVFQ
jgi:hypothetical protein